jgi:hypothetical protein
MEERMLTRQDNRTYDKPRTANFGAMLWLILIVWIWWIARVFLGV